VEITAEFERTWRRHPRRRRHRGLGSYHSLLSGGRRHRHGDPPKSPTRLVPLLWTSRMPAGRRDGEAWSAGVVTDGQAFCNRRRLVPGQRPPASRATCSRSGCGASIPTRRWSKAGGIANTTIVASIRAKTFEFTDHRLVELDRGGNPVE